MKPLLLALALAACSSSSKTSTATQPANTEPPPPAADSGTAAPTCDDPHRDYVARDEAKCAAIRFTCKPDTTYFADSCGCGCLHP